MEEMEQEDQTTIASEDGKRDEKDKMYKKLPCKIEPK